MKPSVPGPEYATAYVTESTCTMEGYAPYSVSCSKLSTSVMVEPSAEMVNVEMKPSNSLPLYANAYVSESTCTRELSVPVSASYSKLFPSDCVFTAVILPSLSIVNVEM